MPPLLDRVPHSRQYWMVVHCLIFLAVIGREYNISSSKIIPPGVGMLAGDSGEVTALSSPSQMAWQRGQCRSTKISYMKKSTNDTMNTSTSCFLSQYRITLYSTTVISPAEILAVNLRQGLTYIPVGQLTYILKCK